MTLAVEDASLIFIVDGVAKSTEEDGRKSNCSPREISEESKYKFNTESGFEVEEEVKSRNSM